MSLIEQAEIELKAINFGEEDTRMMLTIMQIFFNQWDSGGAVSVTIPILNKLLQGLPLSPLTGEPSEWYIHNMDGLYAQNKRCGHIVIRTEGGPAFDINTRKEVTFPYDPT